MRLRLKPQEQGFFDLFARAATNLVDAAELLEELITAEPAARPPIATRIKDVELAADEVTHEIMVLLNSTFVTPFDREDIYRLASSLDDVIDAMEEASDRVVLYRLGDLPAGISTQVEVLRKAAALTAEAMPRLRKVQDLQAYWVAVNSLENEGDKAYRALIAALFTNGGGDGNVLTVLKLKEVIEALEDAADAFETVANTVESIAVKES